MTEIVTFGSLESFIDNLGEDVIKGCIVDTNFAVACLHHMHTFYTDANKSFKILSDKSVSLFSTHTIRSEFLDIHRKYVLTRKIVELYDENGRWKGKVKQTLKDFLEPIVEGIRDSKEEFHFLSDNKLKDIKMEFFPKNESGKAGWIDFCNYFLATELEDYWKQVEDSFGLNYIKIREEETKIPESKLINEEVKWEEMIKVVGATGVGTSDAMIVNVFRCSKLPLLITTDFDVAYAVAGSKIAKAVAIPDKMYERNKQLIKKLLK